MHFGLFWIICIMRSISFCLSFHPDVFLIFGLELLTPGTQLPAIIPLAQKNLCGGGGKRSEWPFPIAGCRTLALPVMTPCESTCNLSCSCFPAAPIDGSGVPSAAWICLPKVILQKLLLSHHFVFPLLTHLHQEWLEIWGCQSFLFFKKLCRIKFACTSSWELEVEEGIQYHFLFFVGLFVAGLVIKLVVFQLCRP